MAATTINIDAYSDARVVLATAGVVVPLVRRWGVSAVLGYLGAGAILGLLGLGSFIDRFPWLYWGHGGRCQERCRHRRVGRGLSPLPDRPGAILPAVADNAPPRIWIGQFCK
jgi:hypothetical protein